MSDVKRYVCFGGCEEHQHGGWIESSDYDALAARLAEAERDRDGGWKAFYALRKAVGEDRYPGLTGVVRTDPPIRPADSAGEKP